MKFDYSSVGKQFGWWTQLGPVFSIPGDRSRAVCECKCGRVYAVSASSLRIGQSERCQMCSRVTHRLSKTPEYAVRRAMIQRCTDKNSKSYHQYGGRGIKVCDRWLASAEDFLSDVGKRPSKKHQLDRIDNSGNYEPGNVRWVTGSENMRNQRRNRFVRYNGNEMILIELSELSGIPLKILHSRISRYGWDVDRAANTPVGKCFRKVKSI